jgi:hypothetical protein
MIKTGKATATVVMAALLWLPVGALYGADDAREYRVRTVDKVASCSGLNGALARAKNEDDWNSLYRFSLYTMGYVTAVNRMAHDTYDIAGKKNTKTLMLWLEQYCATYPDDAFDVALSKMTQELYPLRSRQKP